jgi:hypothetical protein
MGVNDEEQCDQGGAAGDDDNDDRQGDGSKSFGVGGGGGLNKDRQQRRVEEACDWGAVGATGPRCRCPPGAAPSPLPRRPDGPTVTTVIACACAVACRDAGDGNPFKNNDSAATRGSSGSSPPLFFYSGGKTQNSKAKKERKNRWHTELTTIAISVIPNFNAHSRPLAWATIPIAVLSNRQLWRQDHMEHIMLHAVSSPELAILRLRQ